MSQNSTILAQVRCLIDSLRAYCGQKILWAGGLIGLGGLLDSIGMAFLIPLIAIVMGSGRQSRTAEILHQIGGGFLDTPNSQFMAVLVFFVLVMTARAVVLMLRDRTIADIQFGYAEHLQVGLMKRLAGSQWQDLETLRHARISQALGPDLARTSAATQFLQQSFAAAFMLLAQWALTLIIAPVIALAVLVVAVIGGFFLIQNLKASNVLGQTLSTQSLSMMNTSTQFLGGLKLAIAQNLQSAFVSDFDNSAHDIRERRYKFTYRQGLVRTALTIAAAVAGALVLFVGFTWKVPMANLVASFAIFARMNGMAITFVQASQQMVNNIPAHQAVLELMGEFPAAANLPRHTGSFSDELDQSPYIIEFDEVSFGRDASLQIKQVSMTLSAREIVAVTGPSGGGKTTLVDLMAGLISPTEGSIRVAGQPLTVELGGVWRDHISYVTQDSFLLNNTIRNNLNWGRAAQDDAALWEALAVVGAREFVANCSGQLDTQVSERGARFSGGERQRLALARALLRKPKLLILDEATNAIDLTSERNIFSRMVEYAPEMATLVVTHRPTTLDLCTRVLIVDSGKLIASDQTQAQKWDA